jgi:trimethylamine:corrinoid methyltransferase-like protein
VSSFRTWIRNGDTALPRGARALRRALARSEARRVHGSIPAAMDAIVRDATSGTVGSALAPELRTRARLSSARQREAR